MTIINRYMTLIRRPASMPKSDDFKIVEAQLPTLQEGEILLKNLCFSLDPYMRNRMSDIKSYAESYALNEPITGHSISRVEQSRHPEFAEGDIVLSAIGWQTYGLIKPNLVDSISRNPNDLMKLPKDIKPSLFLGALGMPGLSAYHGLLKIGEPQPGDTVVVAAATGPVGSMVGQLAKAKGCRVVGIAGGPDKCKFAVETFGFDACIDHKSNSFKNDLALACPKGINIYFENVGGHVLNAVLPLFAAHARMPLCGMISWYNMINILREKNFSIRQLLHKFIALAKLSLSINMLPVFLGTVLVNRVKVQGFIIMDHTNEYSEFIKLVLPLVKAGKIKYRENIVKGLENTPDTFAKLMDGRAFGKVIIELE
jgi:NADPH-dependent curcumin reductase CurA